MTSVPEKPPINEVLSHAGILGMKWGRKKGKSIAKSGSKSVAKKPVSKLKQPESQKGDLGATVAFIATVIAIRVAVVVAARSALDYRDKIDQGRDFATSYLT